VILLWLAGLGLVVAGIEIPVQHYTAVDHEPESAAWAWFWTVLCLTVGVLTLTVGATRP
jgi:hypothetical protein